MGIDAWKTDEPASDHRASPQVILTLCGLVITVTGFSGGNVIKAGSTSSGFLVAGIICILLSLPLAVFTIGQIRWVTQDLDEDAKRFIKAVIQRRNVHRFRLMMAIVLLVVGLACYMTGAFLTPVAAARECFLLAWYAPQGCA